MSDALGFLPDTKPGVAEPWRKVLLDAADYIEAHGWCQWSLEDSDGRVCAIGGMLRAVSVDHHTTFERPQEYRQAITHLHHYLNGGAGFFNNAHGRTASEVTAALRTCARQ